MHAAGESSDGNLSPGTYAVVLGTEDEESLKRIANNLENLKVPVHRVVESSGKHADQLMALGIKPGPKSERGRWVSNMPLLRLGDFRDHRQKIAHQILRREQLQKEVRDKYIELQDTLWKTIKAAWCGWHKRKGN